MTQKRSIIATKRVSVTLTLHQIEKINSMIGILGSNQSDVLKYIVTNWLEDHK